MIINIEDRYGSVVISRMVDVAVYIEYSNREERSRFIGLLTQIPKKYCHGAIEGYFRRKFQMMYYEDAWLTEHHISRQWLADMVKDVTRINFSTSYEDAARKRFLNSKTGYIFCHMRTSGWDPTSKCCNECTFSDQCREDLKKSYPLLFKQRNENIL